MRSASCPFLLDSRGPHRPGPLRESRSSAHTEISAGHNPAWPGQSTSNWANAADSIEQKFSLWVAASPLSYWAAPCQASVCPSINWNNYSDLRGWVWEWNKNSVNGKHHPDSLARDWPRFLSSNPKFLDLERSSHIWLIIKRKRSQCKQTPEMTQREGL